MIFSYIDTQHTFNSYSNVNKSILNQAKNSNFEKELF